MNTLHDQTLIDLVVEWHYLNEKVKNQSGVIPDDTLNDLIETGLLLKAFLKHCKFTKLQPMNITVKENKYIDIWLDSEEQIQSSGLYVGKN